MKVIRKLKQMLCLCLFRIFPIKKNRILFMSYYGKQINCNPFAIYKEIKKSAPEYECVWVDNSLSFDEKTVRYKSVAFYYYIRTSRFLIFNARPNFDIRKRKNQRYIQTWHSFLGFKMIEKDAEDTLDAKYVKKAKKDSTYIDLLISGCKFRTDCFRRNFWYSGEIAEIGTPRNDVLFSHEKDAIIQRTKRELGVEPDTKIVMYAPTFRNSDDLSYITSLDVENLLAALQKRYPCKWQFVYRLHPNVTCYEMLPEGTINASGYNDMQSLLLTSDILITDYSSAMFDFMLLDRPCFLYCPDYDNYIINERNTYFTIEELPFIVCKTNAELCDAVSDFNDGEYKALLKEFKDRIGSFECGRASEKILEWINNQ
ncbi:MAG: CDP-glycerol glycerophosphotransferase family protein [Eubacteriales bacterium]